jgi:hypothetical protein
LPVYAILCIVFIGGNKMAKVYTMPEDIIILEFQRILSVNLDTFPSQELVRMIQIYWVGAEKSFYLMGDVYFWITFKGAELFLIHPAIISMYIQ